MKKKVTWKKSKATNMNFVSKGWENLFFSEVHLEP